MRLRSTPHLIEFDEETGQITFTFLQEWEPGIPDPVNFQPTKQVTFTVVAEGGVLSDIPSP